MKNTTREVLSAFFFLFLHIFLLPLQSISLFAYFFLFLRLCAFAGQTKKKEFLFQFFCNYFFFRRSRSFISHFLSHSRLTCLGMSLAPSNVKLMRYFTNKMYTHNVLWFVHVFSLFEWVSQKWHFLTCFHVDPILCEWMSG